MSRGPRPLTLQQILDSFWDRVDVRGPNDCWPFKGSKTKAGYGQIQARGVSPIPLYTHRIALSLALGRPLAPEEDSLHRCDNPPCNNPYHLFPGTHAMNMADAKTKGRLVIGGDYRRFLVA